MSPIVFISYSAKDEVLASAIHAFLNGTGIKALKAPDDIAPGTNWAAAITGMIEGCTHMVLIWTSNSMASQEVSKELTLAMLQFTLCRIRLSARRICAIAQPLSHVSSPSALHLRSKCRVHAGDARHIHNARCKPGRLRQLTLAPVCDLRWLAFLSVPCTCRTART